MKRSLKSLVVALLLPATVSAAGSALTPSADLPSPVDTVQDEAGITLELSVWKPGEGMQAEEAAPAMPVRWLRPPRSALLWLRDEPAWSNGANEWPEQRRQMEW